MNGLKNRGLSDILIAVVDGLKGFPEAITAVFPDTVVQTCIVHLIRHSLRFVSWKDRKPVVPALRAIYRAKDAEAGMKALEAFEAGPWGQRYPDFPNELQFDDAHGRFCYKNQCIIIITPGEARVTRRVNPGPPIYGSISTVASSLNSMVPRLRQTLDCSPTGSLTMPLA